MVDRRTKRRLVKRLGSSSISDFIRRCLEAELDRLDALDQEQDSEEPTAAAG